MPATRANIQELRHRPGRRCRDEDEPNQAQVEPVDAAGGVGGVLHRVEAGIVGYRWTLRAFEKHLERKAKLSDLNEQAVNGYVAARLAKWSAHAAKRDRNSLVVWWRFAAKKKLVPPPPIDGIPTFQVPRRNATAWTLKELEQLLTTSSKLQGQMMAEGDRFRGRHCWPSGVARSKFWSSLFLISV